MRVLCVCLHCDQTQKDTQTHSVCTIAVIKFGTWQPNPQLPSHAAHHIARLYASLCNAVRKVRDSRFEREIVCLLVRPKM